VGNHFFAWVKDLDLDHDDPMSALRRFWYDTSTQDLPLALLCAKESYGADRLLLGSDAIFASLTEAVSYIQDSAFLSDEEKTRILDHAAQEVLNLPETVRPS
jgi:predicted TIM-barrel fold metal-dependent hydrolase